MVNPAPTMAAAPAAHVPTSTSLWAQPPACSLGNARHCAPSLWTIDIIINSTVFLWTWMLISLAERAALLGGMRSFFSVNVLFADNVVMVAVGAAIPLLT